MPNVALLFFRSTMPLKGFNLEPQKRHEFWFVKFWSIELFMLWRDFSGLIIFLALLPNKYLGHKGNCFEFPNVSIWGIKAIILNFEMLGLRQVSSALH